LDQLLNIDLFSKEFLTNAKTLRYQRIFWYIPNSLYYFLLLHRFPRTIFLIAGDKSKCYNIYTDLLRHNFIYGKNKTLSKFIVFCSGVRPDKLDCVDGIIRSRGFYIWGPKGWSALKNIINILLIRKYDH
jgi:hypothetical protein